MAPTAEELQLGARAYEQVRIYQKYTLPNLRQLPWILLSCGLILAAALLAFHRSNNGYLFFIFPIFALTGWFQAVTAKKSYASNKMLLQLLEEKYGDSLPWVAERKQLAAAQELESAIKREQAAA